MVEPYARPVRADPLGGDELDVTLDEVTSEAPASPTYREGVSIWLWDDTGEICFPRIGIEAVGASWTTSFETAICKASTDGSLLLAHADEPPAPVLDQRGRPRVFAAGALAFECVEPFDRWRVAYDGQVVVTDVDAYLAGGVPKLRVGTGYEERALRLSVEASMVAPPWFQGTHDPRGHHVPGERRFEQLCRVAGTVQVGEGSPQTFSGGGLRVHRRGGDRNDYGDFHGHNWQSASFPSGRAFGLIHYTPGPDGRPRYREGWVRDGAEVLPAHVEATPRLTRIRPSGEDVSCTLRTARGDVRIEGETVASAFRPPRPTRDGVTFPLLQSGIARYRWGSEETLGMIERSARLGEST